MAFNNNPIRAPHTSEASLLPQKVVSSTLTPLRTLRKGPCRVVQDRDSCSSGDPCASFNEPAAWERETGLQGASCRPWSRRAVAVRAGELPRTGSRELNPLSVGLCKTQLPAYVDSLSLPSGSTARDWSPRQMSLARELFGMGHFETPALIMVHSKNPLLLSQFTLRFSQIATEQP